MPANENSIAPSGPNPWNEVSDHEGKPFHRYQPLLERIGAISPSGLRQLSERLEATLRELGATFHAGRDHGVKPWSCDLLPHVFDPAEWDSITRAFRQRLRAFESFLHDVYGEKNILRRRVLPPGTVLGSPCFLRNAAGLILPENAYLHLCSMCITRDPSGALMVKSHHFARATGISDMMQNRRILSRVVPEFFNDAAVRSIAEIPVQILERLQELGTRFKGDCTPVLLSDGPESPVYSEHSFLARRMGMQIVHGQDLVVLGDDVFLKSIGGLEPVEVIYNRIYDAELDPLVFQTKSRHGASGLLHCLRKGTVALINGPGCQIADDRALLPFADRIVRFYLNEDPVLPTLQTHQMSDVDLREMVLDDLAEYHIRPIIGERVLGNRSGRPPNRKEALTIRREIQRHPQGYVAQTVREGARSVCIKGGRQVDCRLDHMIFALREGNSFEVFPGALTRTAAPGSCLPGHEYGGGSKDSWVTGTGVAGIPAKERAPVEITGGEPRVTSRVAEAFYWLGRYLERGCNITSMLQVIQSLEAEELNSEERRLYRPIWTRLLPRVEGASRNSRRSIRTRRDRYALILNRQDEDSVATVLGRAFANAESVQNCLSPEAWNVLDQLRRPFARTRFIPDLADVECARRTGRLSETAMQLIPQFFAVAQNTMLADDGWRFCQLGLYLERALTTSNAVISIYSALNDQVADGADSEHAVEIQLSAFLRLLGTRDAYRRVYRMRAQPLQVLELAWQHSEAPRSVMHCLVKCKSLLQEAAMGKARGTRHTLEEIESLMATLAQTDFRVFLGEDFAALLNLLGDLSSATERLHLVISDSFLSHQAHLPAPRAAARA